MSLPIASLSLDLDNKWSYLKVHGNRAWEGFPTYLERVVPRFLRFFRERDLQITVFVVGQDAALDRNREPIASIAKSGHEIGNHSFHHEPWLHLYSDDRLEEELGAAEEQIARVTGVRAVGFRGPGFSLSESMPGILACRGYLYDATTFPTFIGPLARAYYFFTSRLDRSQRKKRKRLFGRFSHGFRTLRAHRRDLGEERSLIEIPVTTFPFLKIPIHLSYLLYLRQYSRSIAISYFRSALSLCRLTRVEPSLLLHPLDFMGGEDDPDLSFFPGMQLSREEKLEFVSDVIASLARKHRIVCLRDHATTTARRSGDQLRTLDTDPGPKDRVGDPVREPHARVP